MAKKHHETSRVFRSFANTSCYFSLVRWTTCASHVPKLSAKRPLSVANIADFPLVIQHGNGKPNMCGLCGWCVDDLHWLIPLPCWIAKGPPSPPVAFPCFSSIAGTSNSVRHSARPQVGRIEGTHVATKRSFRGYAAVTQHHMCELHQKELQT